MKKFLLYVVACVVYSANAQFAPGVGQIGTTAISKDSSIFKNWATGCTLTKGYQDISNPALGYVNAGDATMPIGIAGEKGMVSLGDGGMAILTFQYPIANRPGYDFAVFENAFNNTFLELAFVEVSADGINYFRFPAISNIQDTIQTDGFGHTDPTKINNLAGKYCAGYGTPFDLSDLQSPSGLDLNHITHVKIIDVVGCIQNQYATFDSNNHKINDPWRTPFASSGFDLAGVGVIHQTITTFIENINNDFNIGLYPNPVKDATTLRYQLPTGSQVQIALLDITGKRVESFSEKTQARGFYQVPVNLETYKEGLYFLQLKINHTIITKKIMVIR